MTTTLQQYIDEHALKFVAGEVGMIADDEDLTADLRAALVERFGRPLKQPTCDVWPLDASDVSPSVRKRLFPDCE